MDKKGLLLISLILVGGILLGKYREKIFNITGGSGSNLTEQAELNDSKPQTTPVAGNPDENLNSLQNSFSHAVNKAKPALVNISAVRIMEVRTPFHQFYYGDPFEDFFGDFFGRPKRKNIPEPEKERYRYEGTGSGFIVDPRGYILTNYHVIKDAREIKVTTYDDKNYDAEVIGRDPKTDLAVVKIKSSRKFNALVMGDSDNIEIGNWVMAAGSPFGLRQTYTAGIISAVRQNVQVENRAYSDMIQTDAAINRGNSGGPLLDLQGKVIGINTAIFAPTGVFSGIGFAIPINQAKKIFNELIEKGRVVRGWMGVEIKDVDEAVKQQFRLKEAEGVLVNKVIEGSGAHKGGLKRGDVITGVNGVKIKGSRDLQDKVSSCKPGEKLKVSVIRNSIEKNLVIELGEIPDDVTGFTKKDENRKSEIECMGIKVSNADGIIKQRYNLAVSEGAVVVEIDPSGDCYNAGLHVGDVIVELNRIKVKDISDFKKVMNGVDLKKGVVFDVVRNGKPMYLSYRKSK